MATWKEKCKRFIVSLCVMSLLCTSAPISAGQIASSVDPLQELLRFTSAKLRADTDVDRPVDPLRELLHRESARVQPKTNAEASVFSWPECKVSEFTSAEGEDLLELIDSVPVNCIDNWFFGNNEVSTEELSKIFSKKNIIYVAESARGRADEYDSKKGRTGSVGKLYVFLHAGYYNYDGFTEFVEFRSEIGSTLRAFVENQYFYDEGDAHALMLQSIIRFMTITGFRYLFFFEVAKLLKQRHDARSYIQSDREWELVTAILNLLSVTVLSHTWAIELDSGPVIALIRHIDDYDSAFVESSLIELVETLVDIGVSDKITGSGGPFTHIAYSLRQILYFLSMKERPAFDPAYVEVPAAKERPALLSTLKTGLRKLVNHRENYRDDYYDDKNIYIAIGIVAYFYRRNHTHLTDLNEEFLKKILPSRYSCGKHVVVRSQYSGDLYDDTEIQEHQEEVCRTLAYQEELFHSVLDTKKRLAPGVSSEYLEIIAFKDDNRIGLVFGKLPSPIGGYRRRDLSSEHNIAIASANISVGSERFSHVLRHEFVHHLDHVYNLGPMNETYGLRYLDVDLGNFFFVWIEGLAEYLSLENNFGPGKAYINQTISSLFFGSDHDSYVASHLGVCFMFERHPEDVAEILDYIYKEDAEGLSNYLRNSIGTKYDSEFVSWLETVTSNDDPLPRIKRKPRPGRFGRRTGRA